MATNFIGVLLPNSPNYTVNTGFSTRLYDAEGSQTVTVQTGASLSMLGSLGANNVRLSGKAAEWTVARNGSTAILTATDGSTTELAATTTAQTLTFDDGLYALRIDASGSTPNVLLGSQVLGVSAVAVGATGGAVTPPAPAPAPPTDSTTKVKWTLVVAESGNSPTMFISDGTAAGTQRVAVDGGSYSSQSLVVSTDYTRAYFFQQYSTYINGYSYQAGSLGVTNGTASGTTVLAKAAIGDYLPANFVQMAGGRLVMAGGNGSSTGGKVLVSDGTVAGTSVQSTDYAVPWQTNYDYNLRAIDTTNQKVWFAATTAPYGSELTQFNYAPGATPSTAMVKDIYPGSSSGVSFNNSVNTKALLPDGKLVFVGNDGVNGEELWVSDGTAVGTTMIAEFRSGANSGFGWSGFATYGNKVAFVGYLGEVPTVVDQDGKSTNFQGYELVFTDGTSAGTKALTLTPGQNGIETKPVILGEANGLLYFTATAPVAGVNNKGIFSTNGSTLTRLADINSDASLLGWNASKAYFRVSDGANGSELWAADLVKGGFALVKDILPGSGSALGSSVTGQMVGDKLVFTAYTSATTQNLFVSDGTEAGTVQLGNVPTAAKVVGNHLVFADSTGVYGADASSATPAAVSLASGALGTSGSGSSTPSFQADGDQVFFRTSTGDLFATNGTAAGTTKLASSVTSFKVVGEDAIYFVQDTPADPAALWFSDTTLAGTRLVEDLPTNTTLDLTNAVGIHTDGLWIV